MFPDFENKMKHDHLDQQTNVDAVRRVRDEVLHKTLFII